MSPTTQRPPRTTRPIMDSMHNQQSDALSFLDLPGEIRNKIYDHLFSGHILITRNYPARVRREGQEHNAGLPGPKFRFHLGNERICFHDASFGEVRWIRPDVLRVCRLVHEEATTFLYANTAFRFHSMLTINKFLNVAPAAGVKAIRELELQHRTYGEPKLMEHRKWKQCHDKKWIKTCRRISEGMTGVQQLRIDIQICDWPTQLNLAASWAKPLMLLKGKDTVEISLYHEAFSEQRLEATSRMVSKAMMNERSQQQSELAEDVAEIKKMELRGGRLENKVVKGIKVLSITPTTSQLTSGKVEDGSLDKTLNKARLVKPYKHNPYWAK